MLLGQAATPLLQQLFCWKLRPPASFSQTCQSVVGAWFAADWPFTAYGRGLPFLILILILIPWGPRRTSFDVKHRGLVSWTESVRPASRRFRGAISSLQPSRIAQGPFFATRTSRQATHSRADARAVSKNRQRSAEVYLPFPSARFSSRESRSMLAERPNT